MTWTHVQNFQEHGTFGSAVSSLPHTLASAVAVGDLITIGTTVGGDPNSLAGAVADNLGNVYTRILAANGGQLFNATADQGLESFECIVTHAGTPTITYTPDGGNILSWVAFVGDHFTGSDASSTKRASAGQGQTNPGTSADAISSGSVAAQSGDLLWAVSICADGSSTATVGGTGFTASAMDTAPTLISEWKTASGAGAATFTDATNGGAKGYMTIGIAMTPAAGGGGGGTSPMFRGSRG